MPLSSFHCVHSGVFNYTTQQNTTIKKIHTSSHANSGICMPTPKKKKEINKGKKKFWAREDMMAPLGRHCCRAKLQDPPPFSSSFRHSHPLFSYIFQLLHMWKKEENGQEMGNFILPGLAFTTFTTFTTPWPVTMAICRCLANPYGLNPLSPPFSALATPPQRDVCVPFSFIFKCQQSLEIVTEMKPTERKIISLGSKNPY